MKSLNITSTILYIINKSMIYELKILVIKIKLISVNLPEAYIKVLEILVADGKFPNRSEAIRVGIRDLIKTEYLIEDSVRKNVSPGTIEAQIENEIQEKLLI
ncbi:MAG: ribbon-helix-helix domain-containing protein [Promethearchaeota archaeon]